jgi:hypothetical protein
VHVAGFEARNVWLRRSGQRILRLVEQRRAK